MMSETTKVDSKEALEDLKTQIDEWDLPDGEIVRLAPNRYPNPKCWGTVSMGQLRAIARPERIVVRWLSPWQCGTTRASNLRAALLQEWKRLKVDLADCPE